MAKKKNAWIRGSETNPGLVIDLLEKVGGENYISHYTGENTDSIYYMSADDDYLIRQVNISTKQANDIMSNYEELVIPKNSPKDKELVWCWFKGFKTIRVLAFYDAKYHRTFDYEGRRFGWPYDYYKRYKGEYPEWAKNALKLLKKE